MKMVRLGHTKDSLALTHFAMKYPHTWHTYKKDKKTQRAVDRAVFLGVIEVDRELCMFRRATSV